MVEAVKQSKSRTFAPTQTTNITTLEDDANAHPSGNSMQFHSHGEVPAEDAPASTSRQIFLELFAGSANLAKHAHDMGFVALAIDWSGNKHSRRFSILELDLTMPSSQAVLWELIKAVTPCAIHMGIPSNTSERAREKDIPKQAKVQGISRPVPLRSADFPAGLPHLSPGDAAKVSRANCLYDLAIDILLYGKQHQIAVTIENPRNSWFWSYVAFKFRKLPSQFRAWHNDLCLVEVDMCMHGGARLQQTRFMCTDEFFRSLAAQCDNAHSHEPYSSFCDSSALKVGTALQGYPDLFCNRFAECLQRRFSPVPAPCPASVALRAVHQTQPVRSKQLIPEFHQVYVDFPPQDTSGLKILGPTLSGGSCQLGHVKIGKYATPKQFISKAKAIRHPMDTTNPIGDHIKRAIFNVLTSDPSSIAAKRIERIKEILAWRDELKTPEQAVHDSLPLYARDLMKDKQILLLERILNKYGYDDLEVVRLLQEGVKLSGHHDLPPYAERKVIPAISTKDQLELETVWRRKLLLADAAHVEPDLSELTRQEVALGFLDGPFKTEEEVSSILGRSDWLMTPRFLLRQGPSGKLRAIDDCRRSGLNGSFLVTEQLRLEDLDFVLATVTQIGKAVAMGPDLRLELSSGEALCAPVHSVIAKDSFVGRTLDLTKTYKQIFVSQDDRHLVVLAFPTSSGGHEFYTSRSIPFGAVGSVYGFLRLSRALAFIFNAVLDIPTCCYFDDYPSLQPSCLARSARLSAETLLKVLGWKFSETGDKSPDYGATFQVLGAQINLSHLTKAGFFEVDNKPGRVDYICSLLDNVLQKEIFSKRDLAVIRGHLNFASGFFMGKALRAAGNNLANQIFISKGMMSDEVKAAAKCIQSLLREKPPRKIFCSSPEAPVLVFTDSAFKDGRASLGAVVFFPEKEQPLVFDGVVPDDIVEAWSNQTGKQVICQSELLAVVTLRARLKQAFNKRKIILFVDNEAARYCLIKGISPSPSMMTMTLFFHESDLESESFIWIERVASFSNPADSPSRGRVEQCILELGATYAGSLTVPVRLSKAILRTPDLVLPADTPSAGSFEQIASKFL